MQPFASAANIASTGRDDGPSFVADSLCGSSTPPRRRLAWPLGSARRGAGFLLPTLLAACLALASCGDKPPVSEASASANASASASDPSIVKIRPEMANMITLGTVTRGEIWEARDIPGRIEVDNGKVESIGSSLTGRVIGIRANIGDRVTAGQLLAQVSSPELTTAQLAYLRAYSSQQLARSAADRARQLLAGDVIGSAELQRRDAEARIAQAETNAAANQLRLLGFSTQALDRLRNTGAIEPSSPIVAGRAGTVIDRRVNVGQVVQPSDPLFVVADLSSVWVVGGIPEQAVRSIHVEQQVEIAVPATGREQLPGRVVYVGDVVDPTSRMVQVRTEVQNPERAIKPGMMATLRVNLRPENGLVVPDSAVIRDGDQDAVFVRTAENTFKLTPVEVGPTTQGQRIVMHGLTEGMPIVASGGFHLNNERRRAELE